MKKYTLLLGSILFDTGRTDAKILNVDEVHVFNTEEEKDTFIDDLEKRGTFDSYMIMEQYENLKVKFDDNSVKKDYLELLDMASR